jgi:tRNA threonylcarbamoyladenosine biosynthesis protein TsaE
MAAESADDVRAIRLPDSDATHRFGHWLGANLRAGDALALVGELGAGKTTLARGIAAGLAVDDPDAVSSPTYLLVVEHAGPRRLLHADAYLPEKLAGFLRDGGLEYLFDPAAVAVVEWADRVRNLMPARTLWVTIALDHDGARTLGLRAPAAAFPWLAAWPKIA